MNFETISSPLLVHKTSVVPVVGHALLPQRIGSSCCGIQFLMCVQYTRLRWVRPELISSISGLVIVSTKMATSDVPMEIIKEVSMSDSDSDLAEDLHFEKFEAPAADTLDSELAPEGLGDVLAACQATKLAPGHTILTFAKQMIQEHVRSSHLLKHILLQATCQREIWLLRK